MFNKVVISETNLISNVKQVKKNNPNSLICAMVKANAYGVGQKQVVQILNEYVDYFGVACFFEAKNIKRLTNKKILIVGALEKGVIDKCFSYTCHCLEDVEYLIKKDIKLNIHLKVNTGMNRFGFKNIKDFNLALQKIKHSKLNLEGVFTHFATSDGYVEVQYNKFKKFLYVLKKQNLKAIIHADNSVVEETRNHNLNMVRIGFNLYNLNNEKYSSVVEIKSKIVQINYVQKNELVGYNKNFIADRRLKVAIIPIGYADGFDLRYIGFNLIINSKPCKVLNICMDCFMLDVSSLKIKKGDSVYILNKQNSLKRYSLYSKLSEYQVMTNFSKIRAVKLVSPSNCENK